jgi:hypothetical protein
MADRPGQQAGAGPQYSLPKFSAEEQWVQKKQGEFIQGDVRMLSTIDVEKPFGSVQDAVQRLLPFHVGCYVLRGLAAAATWCSLPMLLMQQLLMCTYLVTASLWAGRACS